MHKCVSAYVRKWYDSCLSPSILTWRLVHDHMLIVTLLACEMSGVFILHSIKINKTSGEPVIFSCAQSSLGINLEWDDEHTRMFMAGCPHTSDLIKCILVYSFPKGFALNHLP